MKKFFSFLLLVVFILASSNAASKKKVNMWNEIITEHDPAVKLQKLEEFQSQFGNEQDQYLRLMKTHFALTYYQLKQFDRALEFGEETLQFKDIDIGNKLEILKNNADICMLKGLWPKAIDYARLVIEHAAALQTSEFLKKKFDKEYIQPANFLLAKIFLAKTERVEQSEKIERIAELETDLFAGLDYALTSFKLLRSKETYEPIHKFLSRLIKIKSDRYEQIYRILVELKPIPYAAAFAFQIGMQPALFNENPQVSIQFLRLSYEIKVAPEIAYYLGRQLYRTEKNIDETLDLFMQAIILDKEKKLKDLQGHFTSIFLEKYKDLPVSNQEKIYEELKAKNQAILDQRSGKAAADQVNSNSQN